MSSADIRASRTTLRWPPADSRVLPSLWNSTRRPRARCRPKSRAVWPRVPRKEIVLYVHGYRNSFSDAALTMGELCHFLGREFVCAIFSWPAGGSRGVLFGYEEDYESSEYAVEHIKKAIRTISATPGLEKIHLLAHSRGTAVLTSALAALSVEAYIDRDVIARRHKVGNVVLMAPDLDPDIARAKLYQIISDPGLAWGPAPDPRVVIEHPPGYHMTIYVSPHDKALAASSLLFGAVARLGQIGASTVTPEEVQEVRRLGYIDMIQFTGETGLIGHSYFVSSPQVSSDIIAMIRYGLRPNEPGRPLEEIARPVLADSEAGHSAVTAAAMVAGGYRPVRPRASNRLRAPRTPRAL